VGDGAAQVGAQMLVDSEDGQRIKRALRTIRAMWCRVKQLKHRRLESRAQTSAAMSAALSDCKPDSSVPKSAPAKGCSSPQISRNLQHRQQFVMCARTLHADWEVMVLPVTSKIDQASRVSNRTAA